MKRFLAFCLAALLLLGLIAPVVSATEMETTEETEEETIGGKFGEGFRWSLADRVLTVSGEGSLPEEAPWRDYQKDVRSLVFEGGVTYIGAGTFRGFEKLREIDFGSSLQEIGANAFRDCTGLTEIQLPQSFRRLGESCFEGCTALAEAHFEGYMPNFRSNCLWNGGKMNLYYTPERAWRIEHILELETNFGGRLEVLCEDGTDPLEYRPGDGAFQLPTAPQEETVPPATEAPTEPPTQPPTQPPVTAPPTEATVPETTQEETAEETTRPETEPETQEQTQPPRQEEKKSSGSIVAICLIGGVLSFFLVGALLFRKGSGGGKYNR